MGAKRKRKFQCNICAKVFLSMQSLKRHKDFHVNHRRGFKCGKCANFFMSSTFLKKHHCKSLSCSRDQSEKGNEENLTPEKVSPPVTQTHDHPQIFKCGFCQSCFVSQKVLNQHMAITSAEQHHRCTECTKRFYCAQQFHEHFQIHNTVHKVCYVCGEVLREDEEVFKRHVLSHAEVEEQNCNQCVKKFSTESDLEKHEKERIPSSKSNVPHQNEMDIDCEETDVTESATKNDKGIFTDQDVLRHVHLDFSTSPTSKSGRILELEKEVTDMGDSPTPTRRSARTPRPSAKKLTHDKMEENELLCKICLNVFSNKSSFKKHMLDHVSEKNTQCKICSKTFKRSRYLNDHMKLHLGQEPHKCHICGLNIKYNPSNFRRHMRKHSGNREFGCNICAMSFYRADDLQSHIKTHYKQCKHVCTTCGIGFSTPYKLTEHTQSHDLNTDTPCDMCDKSFVSKTQYHDHCSRVHRGQFMCKLCGITMKSKYWFEKHKLEYHLSEVAECSLTDNREEEKSGHLSDIKRDNDNDQALITQLEDTEEKSLEKSFQDALQSKDSTYEETSDGQGESITSVPELGTDILPVLPKLEPEEYAEDLNVRFQCRFCYKVFASSGNLKRHENDICEETLSSKVTLDKRKTTYQKKIKQQKKTPTKLLGKNLQCPECSKKFSRRCDLKLHARVHAGIKNYVCEICSASYFSVSNLNRHREVHNSQSNNVCHVCGKSFACRNYLFTHIRRIHETDSSTLEKFKCDSCSKYFTSYSNYKRHQRIHTGERPHKCNVCNKAFRRTDDLAVHAKIHSSVKPFQCEICNKSFNQRHNLKKHLKRHDQGLRRIYRCPKCTRTFRQQKAFERHLLSHESIEEEHEGETQRYVNGETAVTGKTTPAQSATTDDTEYSRTAHAIATAISSIQYQEAGKQMSAEPNQSTVSQGPDGRQVIIVLPSGTVAPFQCSLCKQEFPEIVQLVNHMVEHD
ncbi:zinc finger protein 595-like [Ylistrum balloti]|uniref:zinc finger protein 595-like n=1 Tax=Ylistrum balloti TaxID=509963 RepID=UPI002905EA91|nr:zinc finger protein 595-like [Ylistrum balloti]